MHTLTYKSIYTQLKKKKLQKILLIYLTLEKNVSVWLNEKFKKHNNNQINHNDKVITVTGIEMKAERIPMN